MGSVLIFPVDLFLEQRLQIAFALKNFHFAIELLDVRLPSGAAAVLAVMSGAVAEAHISAPVTSAFCSDSSEAAVASQGPGGRRLAR